MALVVKDRVKELSTTTGTSNLTLGGAAYGFQSFAVIGNGNQTYYGIYDAATGDWEVGVGTYSTTGPTLSRDTVLESSNSGSKVVFAAGTKDVFVTYPAERSVYLDTAGSAVTLLDIGTLGVSTANISTANITAGTISTTPTSSNDLVNKTYVDGIAAQGISYHTPVKYEVPNTTGNLNALYSNGTGGVGATLTNNGTLAAFAPDGPTASIGDRILVYNQTNQYENGVYEVSTVGSGSVAWVLTRTADADSYGVKDPNALGAGDAFYVTSGNTGAGETYVCNTAGTITFGTTAITFAQISSAQVYSAGTGLTLSNLQFSITPVGTASTYGSASSVPVFTTNASGQVTSVTNTGISINAAAVSGLAPSATTDTTNAANITSGTLPSARLSGSYTGITGVGTLTAGTWNASTIGVAYGGTGITSYAVGDLLYADTTTSLAKLADVATGNALISGGVGTAPSWGKIGLQTHISGTLQVANGGTGATTLTGYVYGNGTGAMTASTSIPNSATTATSANTASAIVARDASGNFSAGTITASLSGNATTATTATQVSNSVTFNNSGTGAASGNGFNGSSALTVSYNTIGAPSTTGTNASGTWGISISGNAATASNASLLNSLSSTQLFNNMGQNHTTYTDANAFTNFGTQYLQGTTNGPGAGGSQWYMFGLGLGNEYAYSSYAMQFAVPRTPLSGNPYVSIRFREGGSWGSWAKIWAGYADSAGSAGSVDYNNLTNKTGGTGTYTTSGDYRAPIFYDSNNTAYYVDPASTSVLNNTVVASAISSTNNGLRNIFPQGGTYVTGSSVLNGAIRITLPTTNYPMIRFTVKVYTYDGLSFEISCGGHTSSGIWYNTFAYMVTQNRPALNVRFTYGGGNTYVYIGELGSSWSYPQVFITDVQVGYSTYDYTQWDDGWNITFDASSYQNVSSTHTVYPPTSSSNNTNPAYASIYYDAGNTGYYLDGNTSSAWRIGTASGYLDIGPMNSGYCHFQTDRSNFYFAQQAQFDNNVIDYSGNWALYDSYGIHNGSFRAPIFYDSNNTGYYLDPASTSNLNAITWASTGSGGISIGNGTATEVDVSYVSSGGSWEVGFNNQYGTNSWFWYRGGTGYRGGLDQSANMFIEGSSRAPIFYDYNNTGYYVDPASTSEINKVYYNSNMVSRNYGIGQIGLYASTRFQAVFSMGEAYILPADGTTTGNLYGIAWSYPSAGGAASNLASHGMLLLENGSFKGAWGGGSLRTTSDVRGTIFYDWDNTGYYVDPASTSYMVNVQATDWFRPVGDCGLYFQSYGYGLRSAHSEGNDYGNATTYGTGRSGWTGWGLYSRFCWMTNINVGGGTMGMHDNTYGWVWRWIPDSYFTVDRGYSIFANSARAPIFYDSDNTGYYLDPTSTTSLRTVGDWRADAAAWTGEFAGKIQYHASNWYLQFSSNMIFRNSGGTNVMTCDSSGNVTFNANVTAYSDRRKKNNIVTLESAFSYLDLIDARRFDWKDSGKADIGFIAQEVEESGLSMFVHENQIIDPDTNEVLETVKSLDYGRMTAVLWQAVKELKAELNALRAH